VRSAASVKANQSTSVQHPGVGVGGDVVRFGLQGVRQRVGQDRRRHDAQGVGAGAGAREVLDADQVDPRVQRRFDLRAGAGPAVVVGVDERDAVALVEEQLRVDGARAAGEAAVVGAQQDVGPVSRHGEDVAVDVAGR
jgi:hypothetical protein